MGFHLISRPALMLNTGGLGVTAIPQNGSVSHDSSKIVPCILQSYCLVFPLWRGVFAIYRCSKAAG